jgi:hypothetical protein
VCRSTLGDRAAWLCTAVYCCSAHVHLFWIVRCERARRQQLMGHRVALSQALLCICVVCRECGCRHLGGSCGGVLVENLLAVHMLCDIVCHLCRLCVGENSHTAAAARGGGLGSQPPVAPPHPLPLCPLATGCTEASTSYHVPAGWVFARLVLYCALRPECCTSQSQHPRLGHSPAESPGRPAFLLHMRVPLRYLGLPNF